MNGVGSATPVWRELILHSRGVAEAVTPDTQPVDIPRDIDVCIQPPGTEGHEYLHTGTWIVNGPQNQPSQV